MSYPEIGDIIADKFDFLALPGGVRVVDQNATIYRSSGTYAGHDIAYPAMVTEVPFAFRPGDVVGYAGAVLLRLADGTWACSWNTCGKIHTDTGLGKNHSYDYLIRDGEKVQR